MTPNTQIKLNEKTPPLYTSMLTVRRRINHNCLIFCIFKEANDYVSLYEDTGPVVGVRNALTALARQRI